MAPRRDPPTDPRQTTLDDVLGEGACGPPTKRSYAPPAKASRSLVALQHPEYRDQVAEVLDRAEGSARRGRTAQRVGAAFEAYLDGLHRVWATEGYGQLLAWHLHPEAGAKYVRGPEGKQLRHAHKAVADFVLLTVRGELVVVEAKSVDEGARLYRTRIQPQQQAHLEATQRAGQHALLAVEFREERRLRPRRYVVPWHLVTWRVLHAAASLGPEELTGWELPSNGRYLDRFLRAR